MSANIFNDLQTIGLNPFAVQLLAESLLKSPLAPMTEAKPMGFFFPVGRSDCTGWAGVRVTVEAVRPSCGCQAGTCEHQAERECRMTREARQAKEGATTPGCARFEGEAKVIEEKLAISLRISTLAHAARHSEHFFLCAEQGTPLQITDEALFARSVAKALNREGEDGSTPITRMLDKATEWVSEQGEDGIDAAPPTPKEHQVPTA